jgi:hypothetical protein
MARERKTTIDALGGKAGRDPEDDSHLKFATSETSRVFGSAVVETGDRE